VDARSVARIGMLPSSRPVEQSPHTWVDKHPRGIWLVVPFLQACRSCHGDRHPSLSWLLVSAAQRAMRAPSAKIPWRFHLSDIPGLQLPRREPSGRAKQRMRLLLHCQGAPVVRPLAMLPAPPLRSASAPSPPSPALLLAAPAPRLSTHHLFRYCSRTHTSHPARTSPSSAHRRPGPAP